MQENAHVHRIGSTTVDPQRALKQKVGQVKRMTKRNGIRHGAANRPYSRVRSGIRTGTTPHFAAWMADLDVSRALHGIKLDDLAEQLDGRLATTFAVLRVTGRYKTVLQLSKANIADLLRLPSIGIKSLEQVESYLNGQRVRLNWTAA